MATLKSIFKAQWTTANVAKPTIVEAPEHGRYMYSRVVYIRETNKIEDFMGIISRRHYTPESHDAYECWACSSTSRSDCTAIIDEIRRICAQFSPDATDKILQYEGGDWEFSTPYRFKFHFVVLKRKSGVEIVGYT